ncbi:hypothetical protein BN946_scf184911.g19 [Trametes cinnabarina]|uniref:Major facilitator superfamily (MFS) profile domain-containing protein n=1 Tax=Pycnoporus cinnabarinus TaxID=5643 RepID=A0A060SH29_PYCCI|nr:hypothetical protein BN946_scf184911.g19 [Trametes cinnabarina]
MGTNNTKFSLLISAFSLNSTWTPLVGGVLASRLGTTLTSILTTGIIFLGQACLLISNLSDSRFRPHAPFYASMFLTALSFAINLVYVLSSKWLVRESGAELEASELNAEAHTCAASAASMSEAKALKEVAKKRMVYLRDITKLGDVFWVYIGLNVLCGTVWAPFTHLVANILQCRYNLTESEASTKGSYVLAGSVFLYLITGFVVDRVKKRNFIMKLFLLSACLTLACYVWLALPPEWTKTPIPAIISFALGHGFSPLLLVVIVPRIVPLKYVSTTLGAHKALEQTGSTIFQTLAGLALDIKSKKSAGRQLPIDRDDRDVQYLLNAFVILNVLEIVGIIGLAHLDHRQKQAAARCMSSLLPSTIDESDKEEETRSGKDPWSDDENWQAEVADNSRHRRSSTFSRHGPLSSTSSPEQSIPLLHGASRPSTLCGSWYLVEALVEEEEEPTRPPVKVKVKVLRTKAEVRRGEVFALLCGALIGLAWILFMGTAWLKLQSREERGGAGSGDHTAYHDMYTTAWD